MSGTEPGEPDPRDAAIVALLQARDGVLTEVELSDGRRSRVWNIAWGYDAGDSWAHVTTNVSPDGKGEAADFFFTYEVTAIRSSESGALLWPDEVR